MMLSPAFVPVVKKGSNGWRDRMYTRSHRAPQMTTTLSVRIDMDTKKRLEALARRARRSKSFLAAEAIATFVDAESWQLDKIQKGLTELDETAVCSARMSRTGSVRGVARLNG